MDPVSGGLARHPRIGEGTGGGGGRWINPRPELTRAPPATGRTVLARRIIGPPNMGRAERNTSRCRAPWLRPLNCHPAAPSGREGGSLCAKGRTR
jgi:hypothetical protein